jgi:hypothetical protein
MEPSAGSFTGAPFEVPTCDLFVPSWKETAVDVVSVAWKAVCESWHVNATEVPIG